MFERILRIIGKTFLITITAVLTMGFGFVVLLVFLVALIAGFAEGGSEYVEHESLESYTNHYGDDDAETTFVSVPINGVILGERQNVDELFSAFLTEGIVYGYDIKDQLIELAEEEEVAGVILEINSPGGTIFGTQAIVDGVAAFKEKTNKPVIAYVGSVAASGGYWAAASADEVIADHGTVLGSIGVILGPFKYYDGVISEDGGAFVGGVETENGVSTEFITAGKYKDLGNPYRQLTDEERTVLQDSVDNSYGAFVNFVSEKRDIPVETLTGQLGALIYDNIQAQENKLSDSTGSRDDAYRRLGQIVKTDSFEIIQKSGSDSLWSTFSEVVTKFLPTRNVKTGCLFDKHSMLLAYYGDINALCR